MTEYLTQKRQNVLRTIMWLSLCGLCAAVLSLAGAFLYLDPLVPRAESYRDVSLETPLRVYAADGALLAEFGERRLIPITLDQVPQQFIDALLDTEDKRFYEHSGIDYISLTNDVFTLIGTLITEGELGPGASTITMQLARNVSFSLERRFLRKFKEMLLALKIEQELTKDEILELYINLVPFGKRAYGAEAAALTYYGKSLAELNLPQLAMLAGLPQRPNGANPINAPEQAIRRRNVVLNLMFAQDSISQVEYEAAIAAPISAQVYARALDVPSPYAAEWVRSQAVNLLPDLYTGGYRIHTTIDSGMQAEAIAAVRRGLLDYDRRHGFRGAEGQLGEHVISALDGLEIDWSEPESQGGAPPPAAEDSPPEAVAPVESSPPLPPALLADLQTALSGVDRFGGLTPGAVLKVQRDAALVFDAELRLHRLQREDNTWARTYIDVDRRGPALDDFRELFNVGDIVRLRTTAEGEVRLAQLPEIQGALIAMDPQTGAVRSLVGGFDFYRNQYNHALQASRQPGSGFKPFVYSAALDAGVKPSDIFMDAPLVFDDANLESQYRPDNDNNRYNGPTRLREALYRSINLVSIRVLLQIDASPVIEHAAKFGLPTETFPRNTQLAIGGGTMAVTPIDMSRAYAVLANGGYLVDPHILSHIENNKGEVIFTARHPQVCKPCEEQAELEAELARQDLLNPTPLDTELAESVAEGELVAAELLSPSETDAETAADAEAHLEQSLLLAEALETPADEEESADDESAVPIKPAPRVLDERNAYVMTSMLKDVIRRGTGRRALTLERADIAGKTGTTNDAADTWFNGYTPELVTTVWVGFSNHDPLGARAYGSNTPLPIWVDFMRTALEDREEIYPAQPAGVVSVKIDPETGKAAIPSDPDAIFEYFLSEHAPAPPDVKATTSSGGEGAVKAIDLF
ncbi:MAG: transglycosylase domain-containing protein [Pseudomonadota bacterium]